MILFDLRLLLFGVLCTVLAVLLLLAFVSDRPSRRRPATSSLMPLGAASGSPLDVAPLGLLTVEGARVIYANRVAQAVLHLPLGEERALPSADWVELLAEDVAAARREWDDRSPGRFRTVTFASDRTVRWWVSPQGDQDLVLLWDVTREERVQRAGRALISDLGHELRTPIATLLTHLEILDLDQPTEPLAEGVRRQSLRILKREAQRMSRLINDMLELGRLESAETPALRPLDLVVLAEEVVLQTMPRARDLEISLELRAASGLSLVMGHSDRLRQVLLNLLDNALKYAGSGAQVTVALDHADDGVMCAVCDDGPGIPPEHLGRIGQRFYRAAPETIAGSGLGLSMVREVLRLHRSDLTMTSPVEEGRGTCARFVLPVAAEGA